MSETPRPRITHAVPVLPSADVPTTIRFWSDQLGFEAVFADDSYAVVGKDGVFVHLWSAGDDSWRDVGVDSDSVIVSGAESFIAGTASVRIHTDDVDAIWDALPDRDAVHPVFVDGIAATDHGTREYSLLDPDGNLITLVGSSGDP